MPDVADLGAGSVRTVLLRVGGYAVVVREGAVLLARVSVPGRVFWTVPGGGIDPGEDPADAAVREVREETGFDVALDGLLGVDSAVLTETERLDGGPGELHLVRVVHAAHVVGGALRDEVGGSTDQAAWVLLDDLPTLTRDPFLDRALRLAGIT